MCENDEVCIMRECWVGFSFMASQIAMNAKHWFMNKLAKQWLCYYVGLLVMAWEVTIHRGAESASIW